MVEGDRSSAEKDEAKGQGGKSQGEFVSAVAHQPVMEVYFSDGDAKIDADGKSSAAGEEADKHEQAAKKFGERGDISQPGGNPQAGNEVSMLLKSAEDLVVSVAHHDSAKGKTHHQECEGLQPIEVAQVVPPCERQFRLQQAGSGKKATLLATVEFGERFVSGCSAHPQTPALVETLFASSSPSYQGDQSLFAVRGTLSGSTYKSIENHCVGSKVLITFFRLRIWVAGDVLAASGPVLRASHSGP